MKKMIPKDKDMIYDLFLPASGLAVKNGYIYHQDEKGRIYAKFSLDAVDEIEFHSTVSFKAIIQFLALSGGIFLAHRYIPYSIAKWAVIAVLGIFALLVFFNVQNRCIEFKVSGEKVSYAVIESKSVVQGFVLSLKEMKTGF